MKAIAEYFRDLAAEDRYFGAEPPTPDAAMLHKIAEREIQRRVEAKIQDNGVILRAGDMVGGDVPRAVARQDAPYGDAPQPAPARVQIPHVDAVDAPVVQPAAQPAVSESVAAKLMRIRSAVSQVQPVPVAPAAVAAAVAEYSEDQHADVAPDSVVADSVMPVADDLPVARYDVADEDTLPEDDFADMSDDLADDLAEDLSADQVELTAADDFATDTAADDDILANLTALAVPSRREAAQDDLNDPFDDLADDDVLDDLAVLDAAADLPDDDFVEQADAEDPEDDISGLLNTLNTPANSPAEAAADLLAEGVTDADSFAEDEDGDDWTLTPTEPVAEAAPADDAVVEDTVGEERAQRARARVIKIRRAEPASPPAATARAAAATEDAALSPEAEADLMRELAEATGDLPKNNLALGDLATDPLADAGPARPTRPTRPVRSVSTPRPVLGETRPRVEAKAAEPDVNRLIAQTNTEMEGPENRRRLSAIAHLKAAVAATVADRRAGTARTTSEAERIDPYRNDLSRMVRPTPAPSIERPATATERPSPLVLVSEQRVDRRADDAAPARVAATRSEGVSPVRPRRLGAGAALAVQPETAIDEDDDEDLMDDEDENIFTDAKGFAEFADRLGAHGLQDLLEAAAAYTSCVEGRPHFSRPQLIRQISDVVDQREFTRENGLRGFGALLRAGKIEKVKRGQYALTETSHYLTEARKLVG